jgi:hypothetical protein
MHNESITLMDMTATSMAPNFYYAAGQDAIPYTRKVENPYRGYYGIPARTTYSGMSISE